MNAAIYARKSTDQLVADEAKSVTRQVENARAFAVAKGWTVADAHIYIDDGISGAEFERRPGLQRLLATLPTRQRLSHATELAQSSIRCLPGHKDRREESSRLQYDHDRRSGCFGARPANGTGGERATASEPRERSGDLGAPPLDFARDALSEVEGRERACGGVRGALAPRVRMARPAATGF